MPWLICCSTEPLRPNGLIAKMPRVQKPKWLTDEYATITLIMFMSSMGLPLLNGFVGEFTILQGTFMENKAWAAWAVPGVVLAAAYLLWLYQRVFFGPVNNPKNEKLFDLSGRELATFVPLVIMAFWIGLYPKPFFQILSTPVNNLVATVRPDYPGLVKPEVAGQPAVNPNPNAPAPLPEPPKAPATQPTPTSGPPTKVGVTESQPPVPVERAAARATKTQKVARLAAVSANSAAK